MNKREADRLARAALSDALYPRRYVQLPRAQYEYIARCTAPDNTPQDVKDALAEHARRRHHDRTEV